MQYTSRKIPALVTLIIAFCLGVAYFAEFYQGINPCPLCLLQRYLFMLVGVFALLAWVQGPGRIGRLVYAIFIWLGSLGGAALSARQIYLQMQPPGANEVCLPGLDYLLQTMHWVDVLRLVITGSPECGTIQWRLLGMSMADWSMIIFVIIVLLTIYWVVRKTSTESPK